MCLTVGKSSGNITAIKPARESVREMENEALDLITWRLQAVVSEQNPVAAGSRHVPD